MYRGILSVTYAAVKPGVTAQDFATVGRRVADGEVFLRYRESVDGVELRHVQHTNYCDFSAFFDEKIGMVEIVSAIDNLVKGAAGQAIQNFNVMYGLPESTGII